MSEWSLPMPGTTIGDAGPYAVGGAAAPGWWDRWGVESRAGGRLTQVALASIGVFYCVDDQLECTIAADTTSIDVDEGAAQVDGIFYWNDTDPVNVPIPAAGAGDDRIDLIVVRKNFQAATDYTPGGGAPTCLRRETRITVIRGVEAVGPVAPTVTQDVTRATYWDIPLYTVQVDDAGALTELTDLREYVDAETKRLFIPTLVGYNHDDSTDILLDPSGSYADPVLLLVTAKDCSGYGRFAVPNDFIDNMTMTAVIMAVNSGTIYCRNRTAIGACGQNANTHTDVDAYAQVAITAGTYQYNCISEYTLASVALDDIVRVEFQRDGSDALDTLAFAVRLSGWIIEYLGWKQ